MKVSFNKVLNHSLQIRSCKEIIKRQKDQRTPTYKRCGSELLTIGISKEKQSISVKIIDERFEEFKKEVIRMEQYMVSYIQKLSNKLVKFADDRRKQLKQKSVEKDAETVQGTMPRFEYSKTRISNFKRMTQILLGLVPVRPDEKTLDQVYSEIETLTGAIVDLEKEILELKNGIPPEPPVEAPVIEVVDFHKMNFVDKSEYIKNRGMDIGFLRNINDFLMTKDGSHIYVCKLYSVCTPNSGSTIQ